MKIAILTYQYAVNYGGLLQAYALKTYLEKNGNDVEILNYDTSYLYMQSRSTVARIKSSVWNCVRVVLGGGKKISAMATFRKDYLHLCENKIDNREALNEYIKDKNFDAVIVGSDQVWNPEINSADTAYLLDLSNVFRKISYAGSFGKSDVDSQWLDSAVRALEDFRAVSVREKTAKQLLIYGGMTRDIHVVLDPVFLLTQAEWKKICGPRLITEPYILCYCMPGDSAVENRMYEMIGQLKGKTGYKVFFVGRKEYCRFKNDGTDLLGISPNQFVNLIANAEYVVTNSFHGTAFSVIFQKQFYSFVNPCLSGDIQLSSRITDLLSALELEQCLITDNMIINDMKATYEEVQNKLTDMINSSCQFLQSALQ